MKSIINYLDELKEKLGSDYRIAARMEVDKTVIAKIRKRNAISDENAVKMADLLGIPREEILIAAAIARSEGEVKGAWEKLYKNVSRAAVVILAVSLLGYKSDAYASNQVIDLSVNNIHYAKSIVLQIWLILAILSFFTRRNKNAKTFKLLSYPS
jgi:hypothetical protein